MTRAQWIALGLLGPPAVLGAAVMTATLGPYGGLFYGGLLLAGVNAPHLLRLRKKARPLARVVHMKDRRR